LFPARSNRDDNEATATSRLATLPSGELMLGQRFDGSSNRGSKAASFRDGN